MVTDNDSNYVSTGKLLCEKYKTISWSPCVAHCLNLVLQDMGDMPHVDRLKKRASKVIVFIYDNCIPFNVVNSVYYQKMIDAIAAAGPGYKGPSYHAVRVDRKAHV